jgi:hypothetical protein
MNYELDAKPTNPRTCWFTLKIWLKFLGHCFFYVIKKAMAIPKLLLKK